MYDCIIINTVYASLILVGLLTANLMENFKAIRLLCSFPQVAFISPPPLFKGRLVRRYLEH